jgi:3-deoxy-manno-octulosonate cytidylyltransferase (CMP-KDO synthetase)
MTGEDHASGTDRIAEVAQQLNWHDQVIVVNLQGDEPLMPPANVRQVAELLSLNPEAGVATLCTPISDAAVFNDPSVVKVVPDGRGRALYFSRSAIPHMRDAEGVPHNALRHLGLYAYRASALRSLAAWPPCDLEISERLEQLRALWHGLVIQVDVAAEPVGPGVDTPADIEAAEAMLRKLAEASPGP